MRRRAGRAQLAPLRAADATLEDDDNLNISWLVEAVCQRPTWFTATGSLSEVLCYLSGVYAGMLAPGSSPEQRERAKEVWYSFLGVSPGLHWPPTGEWRKLERTLRADFADDAAALAHQAQTYRAYRRRLEERDSTRNRRACDRG